MGKVKHLNIFDRFLSLWVVICILAGIAFGKISPVVVQMLGNWEIAQVNLPIGILIWIMIIPMLIRVDLKEIHHVREFWKGSLITLGINWLVKPFSMAFLGWFFLKYLFSSWLPTSEIDNYIAGLIILAAAPCTAMVFVWSYLCDGEPHFTLTQVALNDLIMIFAFVPIVGLLLGITGLTIPWDTLLISVMVYILIPFLIAQGIRYWIINQSKINLVAFLKKIHPYSVIALLAMLILLFSFQGYQILQSPIIVFLIAIPILIQVYFNSMLAYGLNKIAGEQYRIAGPSALIGASNFFELAVATAITLFGFKSGAALATVVGVLIEVPVMLSVVKIVNTSKKWYVNN
ncbi:MAG: ACR3 family arsenite efflux transporter [Gammaproteobacteria bacterium]